MGIRTIRVEPHGRPQFRHRRLRIQPREFDRPQVQMSFEIVRVFFQPVADHRLLQLAPPVAGTARQPQVAHFVGGLIAGTHPLRRMVLVAHVGRRIVVVVAHVDHRVLGQKQRFAVVVDCLPVGIPVGNAHQPFLRAAGQRGPGFQQLPQVMRVRVNRQNIDVHRQAKIVGDREIARAGRDVEGVIVLQFDDQREFHLRLAGEV